MNKLLFKPKQKDWSIPNKGSKISHEARSPMTTEIPAAIKWSKLLSSECWNPIRSSCDPPVHRVPHGGQSESLWDCSNSRRNLRAHRGTFCSAGCPRLWSHRAAAFEWWGPLPAQDCLFNIVAGFKWLVCRPLRADLHAVGTLRFMSDVNQPSLPTPYYSVLAPISVVKALSTVFHSIISPDNSPFSDSVLPVLSLPYWSFQPYISLWKSPSSLI